MHRKRKYKLRTKPELLNFVFPNKVLTICRENLLGGNETTLLVFMLQAEPLDERNGIQ
jgi:hypothetical protein